MTNTVIQATGYAALLGPMAISPDGKTIYVDSAFSATPGLLVIDAQGLFVRTTIPMGAANGLSITPDGKYVYVPNLGNGEPYSPGVAVVDTSNNTVTATIPLNNRLNPGYAQISPDGSLLYVSEFPLYTTVAPVVVVISTATNQITGQITLIGKQSPGAIAFAPAGKVAWVTAGGAAVDKIDVAQMKAVAQLNTTGSVGGPAVSPNGRMLLLPNDSSSQAAAINQATGANLAGIPVGSMNWSDNQLYDEYGGAAASPDGTRVYVTNFASSNVSAIDTATKAVVANVNTGDSPVGVAVSPDGSKAYVANYGGNSVTIINTQTWATRQIPMPAGDYTYPSSIAISPDGSHVYVAGNNPIPDFGTARCFVFVIDTSTNKVTNAIRVPYPMALAVSPDGRSVYVAAGMTQLYTISTSTNTVINKLFVADAAPEQPVTSGLAVTPDGTRVFLNDGLDNRIFEVDVTQNKVLAAIRAGKTPGVLAVTPDGTQVWASDYYGTSASVIDIASGTVTQTIPLGNQSYGIAFAPQ